MRPLVWTIDTIKIGIDRFYQEQGRYPTAIDFDSVEYLPSARQIQRKFGGMEKLRSDLNISELNYTKGALRQSAYNEFAQRSISAEDDLEIALVEHFGELFVHTQKRYYKLMKNRWDFFVYHHGGYLGIDVFSTNRASYIMRNINHKLKKYADVPPTIPIYFVVDINATDAEIKHQIIQSKQLKERKIFTWSPYAHFYWRYEYCAPSQPRMAVSSFVR